MKRRKLKRLDGLIFLLLGKKGKEKKRDAASRLEPTTSWLAKHTDGQEGGREALREWRRFGECVLVVMETGRKRKKKKKRGESYQSCCQSPGQVVIRTAARQWLVSVSHSHIRRTEEKDPAVFTSTAHEWTQHRCAEVRSWTAWQPFVDYFGGREMTENTDYETWGKGKIHLGKEFTCLSWG